MDSSVVLTQSDSLSRTEPLVSVIIPVYKVEAYLRECVDSVLSQTYANLEIILVDDGSPDGCPAICDAYAAKDSRVRVIHKENGGLSDARNAGMKIASADWWTFVDSDDVIHPQMIELLMKPMLKDSAVTLSTCEFVRFVDEPARALSSENPVYESRTLKEFGYTVSARVAWGKIYHRNLFSGISYPKRRLHEDEFITYKLMYKADSIAYIGIPLYFYRQREDSIMAHMSKKRILDTFDAYRERICFFEREPELYEISIRILLSFYVTLRKTPYPEFDCKQVSQEIKALLKNVNKQQLRIKTKILLFLKLHALRFVDA